MTSIPEVARSQEVIAHFRCVDPRCEQWWSIGDFDLQQWGCLYIHGPRCGRLYRLDSKSSTGVLAA